MKTLIAILLIVIAATSCSVVQKPTKMRQITFDSAGKVVPVTAWQDIHDSIYQKPMYQFKK